MYLESFTTRTALVALGLVVLLVPRSSLAHCDTLDGPVVMAARAALDKGDVTPVLRWVRKEDEGEIRTAFAKSLTVRTKGPEAHALADTYFFETLVRVHRAGEGAPFDGLKPAGIELLPAVTEADRSLETGSIETLVALLTGEVAAGIRDRFTRANALKGHADESVEAGRQFVEAYVAFVHYVEALGLDAEGSAAHEADNGGAAAEQGHAH